MPGIMHNASYANTLSLQGWGRFEILPCSARRLSSGDTKPPDPAIH